MMRILLLGAPGAGKGTQAAFISQQLGLPKIAAGDMLREAVQYDNPIGQAVKQHLADGTLVPDEIIIELVLARLQQADCAQGYLLDGFPRTTAQAQALADAGVLLEHVIQLVVSDDVIVERIAGRLIHPASGRVYHRSFNPPQTEDVDDVTGEPLVQRGDDNEATVRKRLQVYQAQTEPLVAYYQQQIANQAEPKPSQYHQLDGEQSVAAVQAEIAQLLGLVG